MNTTANKPAEWPTTPTRLTRYFVIALLLHAGLLAVLVLIKVVSVNPYRSASFDAVPLPPALPEKKPDDPNAAYRNFDYKGPTLGGGGGGTPGNGPGGVPTAGAGLSEPYPAQILNPSVPAVRPNGAQVIGVRNDIETAIARPADAPSGVNLTAVGSVGDMTIGPAGIKGPGGNIFGARMGPQRAVNLDRYHGNSETEKAVLAALRWLKNNQEADGSWKCGKNPPAGAALAILAFLGHGETPDSAEFGQTVSKGLEYLAQHVNRDGLVTGLSQDSIGYDYSQGSVVLALSEGYALTQSPLLREPLVRALQEIIQAQAAPKTNPLHVGGWRYRPHSDESDVSVTGWMILALESAKAAGLDVPPEVLDKAGKYLWNMYDTKDPGFGYQTPERYPSMTAVGVLCQQFLGNGNDRRIKGALDYLREQKADWRKTEGDYVLYGWYYITQAMFQAGGPYWQYWNREIRDTMMKNQQDDGRWLPPPNSAVETRELAATPAYSTALGALILETYYRYSGIENRDSGSSTTAINTGRESKRE
jgi:hypothetical protein